MIFKGPQFLSRIRAPSCFRRGSALCRSFAVLPVLMSVWGCGSQEEGEFRIGLLSLTSGAYREASGDPSVRGAQLAVEEIRMAGGLKIAGRSHRVRLFIKEHDARADDAASKARALLNQDSVHVLVGPQLSAHAIAVAVIAEAAEAPMISPMSTNPQTTEDKEFVFRLATLDDTLGAVMARYARQDLGMTRGAILMDEAAAYSRDLSASFTRAFEEEGGAIVAIETYTTDQAQDFTDQLSRLKPLSPDFIFLPNGATEAGIQMRQARELGLTARFLGSDSWDLLGYAEFPWSEGALVTHQWHYDIPTPHVAAFLQSFQERYGVRPRTTAAMTYDAVRILAQAAVRAGSLDPAAIRDAVEQTKDYMGAIGGVSFDGRRDPERTITLSTIRNGEVVVLRNIDP